MELTYFIGVDVSKNDLDFAVVENKAFLFHKKINNSPTSIVSLLKELAQLPGFSFKQAVFCMEHTGIYSNHLLGVLFKKQCLVCLEAALHIRNSLGNIRGKSDKIDAIRIAEYAYKNREQLRLWQPKREVINRLAQLSGTRSRLIEAQKVLTIPIKESKEFIPPGLVKENTAVCQSTLKALKTDLIKVDKAIQEIIASDPELSRLFVLITSVDGIGKAQPPRSSSPQMNLRPLTTPLNLLVMPEWSPLVKNQACLKEDPEYHILLIKR